MSVRPTPEQFSLLLDYMEEHPKLFSGTIDPTFNIQQHRKCWNEVADILNASGTGAIQTSRKWKKSWTDWKCCVLSKAAALKRKSAGAGSCPPAELLNEVEERLMGLVGWTRVTGLQAVPEAGIYEDEPLPKRPAMEENNDPFNSHVAETILVMPSLPVTCQMETPSCSASSQSAGGQSRRRRAEQQEGAMAAACLLADVQRQQILQSARLADAMERIAAAHAELAPAVREQTTEVTRAF